MASVPLLEKKTRSMPEISASFLASGAWDSMWKRLERWIALADSRRMTLTMLGCAWVRQQRTSTVGYSVFPAYSKVCSHGLPHESRNGFTAAVYRGLGSELRSRRS